MRHTNIIVIKDIIVLKKAKEKEKLLEGIMDIIILTEVA